MSIADEILDYLDDYADEHADDHSQPMIDLLKTRPFSDYPVDQVEAAMAVVARNLDRNTWRVDNRQSATVSFLNFG